MKLDIAKDFNGRDFDINGVYQLLQSYGPLFWSWGAEGFVRIKNKALRFKSNGHHHKGLVYISLNGSDLFDIHLTTLNDTIVEVIKDIYREDLFDTIDKKIEFIEDYVR